MPIKVKFGDFQGRVFATLLDPGNALHRLQKPEDESFRLANSIDWYGTTVLKSGDMPEFLKELDRVLATPPNADDTRFLVFLRELAVRCSREARFKLEFVGD